MDCKWKNKHFICSLLLSFYKGADLQTLLEGCVFAIYYLMKMKCLSLGIIALYIFEREKSKESKDTK